MTSIFRIIIISMAIISLPTEARMYQWVDSETGTTQLSGKPPAWYRSGQTGPRIFVFERGQLVDDTGIKVSEEQRGLLRQRSFDIANEESIREKAKSILSKQNNRVASDDAEPEAKSEESKTEKVAEVEEVADAGATESDSDTPEDLSGLSVEDMRQLILDWEEAQKQKAKDIINQ